MESLPSVMLALFRWERLRIFRLEFEMFLPQCSEDINHGVIQMRATPVFKNETLLNGGVLRVCILKYRLKFHLYPAFIQQWSQFYALF
jgi:hypothetical protein